MNKIYTTIFFISVVLTLAAVSSFAFYGLNLGVDFRGGSIVEVEFSDSRPDTSDIQKALLEGMPGLKNLSFSLAGERGLMIKTADISEQEHQEILGVIKTTFPSTGFEEKRFDSVGPVVGEELKNKSIIAIVLVLICVIFYIALVFRKMSVVLSPWAMGLAAVAALFHDIIIPAGIFAALGHYYGVEISAVFVAAILTILGYSVSDTVVIFDRVRENVIRNRAREAFGAIVHKSIIQTLTRSLNTTFTTLLSLIAIYLFGGESLKYFALALMIGIFLGAYSSIFVASPILVWWSERFRSKK